MNINYVYELTLSRSMPSAWPDYEKFPDLPVLRINDSAMILRAFENRLRAGLVWPTMQTNPAVEQNKNVHEIFNCKILLKIW